MQSATEIGDCCAAAAANSGLTCVTALRWTLRQLVSLVWKKSFGYKLD
jgi:hypothetical protein